jgi:hypothetical protein
VIQPHLAPPLALVGVVLGLWFLPRRTWSGQWALRTLRASYGNRSAVSRVGSAADRDETPDSVGLGVALYGRQALLALLPRVTNDAGLLDGGKSTRRLDFPG